jgi:carboxymethylenebutenolidase
MGEPADNPRQNVTFDSAGTPAFGYLATPAGGRGPGVILIQEWWGLDDHIADMADRLAAEGFVVLAPDLLGGRVTHDSDEAGAMMMAISLDTAVDQLSGAVDYLLANDAVTSTTVGTIGFCMGGGFVLRLAAQLGDKISAAVPFYGVGPAVPDSYANITAAIQGHYAEHDDFYPIEAAQQQEEKIRYESGAEVTFYYYPAGHAFLNDKDRLGTYDADNAALAWQRAVAFLKQKLR